MAPEVVLGATHVGALEFVPIEALTARAVAPMPSRRVWRNVARRLSRYFAKPS